MSTPARNGIRWKRSAVPKFVDGRPEADQIVLHELLGDIGDDERNPGDGKLRGQRNVPPSAAGLVASSDPVLATHGLFGIVNHAYRWYRPGRGISRARVVNELPYLAVTSLGVAPSAAGTRARHARRPS